MITEIMIAIGMLREHSKKLLSQSPSARSPILQQTFVLVYFLRSIGGIRRLLKNLEPSWLWFP